MTPSGRENSTRPLWRPSTRNTRTTGPQRAWNAPHGPGPPAAVRTGQRPHQGPEAGVAMKPSYDEGEYLGSHKWQRKRTELLTQRKKTHHVRFDK